MRLIPIAVVALFGLAMLPAKADAAPKKRAMASEFSSQQRQATPRRSAKRTARTRSRARITVQRRSFLDAGTELLPGERKFTDYALPPNYSPTAVIDNTAFSHRSPLPGPFTLPSRNNPYPWSW